MTAKAKKLVILERLLKQDHLFDEEQLKEIKGQLKVAKDELRKLELKTSKGFGKV